MFLYLFYHKFLVFLQVAMDCCQFLLEEDRRTHTRRCIVRNDLHRLQSHVNQLRTDTSLMKLFMVLKFSCINRLKGCINSSWPGRNVWILDSFCITFATNIKLRDTWISGWASITPKSLGPIILGMISSFWKVMSIFFSRRLSRLEKKMNMTFQKLFLLTWDRKIEGKYNHWRKCTASLGFVLP